MDALLTVVIAFIGTLTGLFIASGRLADVAVPLTLALTLAALRLSGVRFRGPTDVPPATTGRRDQISSERDIRPRRSSRCHPR